MAFLLASVANHPAIAPLLRGVIDAGDIGSGRIVRSVNFASPEDKANWIDAMCTLDARLPLVREQARKFAMARTHDPNAPDALARDFQRFVRDGIRYIKDPAGEELSDSEQTLRQGFGDCDDKARLFCSLCRTVQIPARIRPCFDAKGNFVHVQAEVKLDGEWVLAELIVRDLPLGEYPRPGKQVLQ